jgi:ferredoxin
MAHSQAKKILKQRGLSLGAGFSLLMPGNYTPLYGAIPREKQEERFRREKARAQEIAAAVREKRRGIFEEKPFLINFLLHKLLYKGGTGMIPLSGKNFRVGLACSKCGLCAKICPVENIKLADGTPRWLNHCQHCMACLQWCPVEAIQYGKSTEGRKRYRHPGVSAQDIMGQQSPLCGQ